MAVLFSSQLKRATELVIELEQLGYNVILTVGVKSKDVASPSSVNVNKLAMLSVNKSLKSPNLIAPELKTFFKLKKKFVTTPKPTTAA